VSKLARAFGLDVSELVVLIDAESFSLNDQIDQFEKCNYAPNLTHTGSPFDAMRQIIELPSKFVETRIMLGWSQTDLAKRASLQPRQLSLYETSRYQQIRLSRAIELAQILINEADSR
jgi:DNA-binding XRE family transcriptional regulator